MMLAPSSVRPSVRRCLKPPVVGLSGEGGGRFDKMYPPLLPLAMRMCFEKLQEP